MPREPQGGHHDHRRSVEWRDPRGLHDRAPDHDVRMDDRRDRELFHDLPSVTNRTFGEIDAGDGFGYAGQGGYGQDLRMGDHPIAWTNCIGKGRMFYSAIGHRPETYSEPHYVALLEAAIDWAAVSGKKACRAGK